MAPRRKKPQLRSTNKMPSWLSQNVNHMINMSEPGSGNQRALRTFKTAVDRADRNQDAEYYDKDGKLHISVKQIPYGMQNDFRGLQAVSTDDSGNYTMNVLTTHNLNSAQINVFDAMHSLRPRRR